ncbi:MAG: hypothetical protein P8Y39_09385 [Nitrospirota bacterium]
MIPAAFLLVASMPVDVLGCRNRGLLAVGIAIVGALGSLGASMRAVVGRTRSEPHTYWWVLSALVMMMPAVVVVVLAR